MSTTEFAIPMLFVVALTACASSTQREAVPRLVDTGTPVLHAIDSGELRLVMKRMNNLMFERNLTEQEMDVQRQEAISKVKNAAIGLEQAVGGILDAEPKLKLDESEKKVFRYLAIDLRSEAQKLKAQADAFQSNKIPATLEQISATCTSCHKLFRDFNKQGVSD